MALDIEFKRELHLHDEGYDTDANYEFTSAPEEDYLHLCSNSSDWNLLWPHGSPGMPNTYTNIYPKRKASGTLTPADNPQMSELQEPTPMTTMVPDNNEEEEYFPTVSLDDAVWPKETILERDLCIYMAPRRPGASYPSQIPTQPQEPVYEPATLEELMDSMFSDMPNLVNISKEVFFQNWLYTPWM